MSRGAFIIGLLVSSALHVWLLRWSAPAPVKGDATQAPPPATAPVMETELASLPQPPEPPPEPPTEPATEPEPAREPEPTPAPAPTESTPAESIAERPADPSPPPVAEPQTTERASSQPDLADMAQPERASSLSTQGDLAGRVDSPERPPEPELRIDWGDERNAIQSLRAGGMKLAVLSVGDSGPIITAEGQLTADSWRRAAYQPQPRVRYSNRLRVVDEVPAFRRARRDLDLKPTERLVVLVPSAIERLLESTQLSAAFERGLNLEQVRRFGGRFVLGEANLDFEVTRIQRRRAP